MRSEHTPWHAVALLFMLHYSTGCGWSVGPDHWYARWPVGEQPETATVSIGERTGMLT